MGGTFYVPEGAGFDHWTQGHRKRLDRLGGAVLILGFLGIGLAGVDGPVGGLETGDWMGAGGPVLTAGAVLLTLGAAGHSRMGAGS